MKSYITESNIYKEFTAERDEILRHKWIESEKLGSDIGFDRALVEWVVNYRNEWRKYRTTSYIQTLYPPTSTLISHEW